MQTRTHTHIYIYIYICVCVCVSVYVCVCVCLSEVPSISLQTFFRMGTFIDSTHMKL